MDRVSPDVMSAKMSLVGAAAPFGSRWRDGATGCEYEVHSHCFLEADASPAILYAMAAEGEHPIWARSATEFLDGRFERIFPENRGSLACTGC